MLFFQRKSPRASWLEYNEGMYFITVCTLNKKHYFGMIQNDEMWLSAIGKILEFELNNVGGSVKSEAIIEVLKRVEFEKDRELIFNDTFILYLKEQSKEKPYLALRVDDVDVLESI